MDEEKRIADLQKRIAEQRAIMMRTYRGAWQSVAMMLCAAAPIMVSGWALSLPGLYWLGAGMVAITVFAGVYLWTRRPSAMK